jgi:hypothetical protein
VAAQASTIRIAAGPALARDEVGLERPVHQLGLGVHARDRDRGSDRADGGSRHRRHAPRRQHDERCDPDHRGDRPAARRGQVHRRGQRRERSEGEGRVARGPCLEGVLKEQRNSEGDEAREPVPVVEGVAQARVAGIELLDVRWAEEVREQPARQRDQADGRDPGSEAL